MSWRRDTLWGYIHLKKDQEKEWEKAKKDARREFTKEQEEKMRKEMLKEMRDDYQIFIENTKRDLMCDYSPQNESGVVFLFGRYYDVLGFSKIVSINTTFPDCHAIKDGEEVDIEFEFLSSGFLIHQKGYHSTQAKDVDYVVCWEKDVPLKGVKIIELKKKLKPFLNSRKVDAISKLTLLTDQEVITSNISDSHTTASFRPPSSVPSHRFF